MMKTTEVGATVPTQQYFESYEDLEVHKLMLDDVPRTEAYKNAILSQKSVFKDKVVMDVGAGTGILSLFCAEAGAKTVYAVEASSLANLIREVVEENNFSHVIKVLHARVEDVTLDGGEKVDLLVSEWMGFYLLHEGMLDSVLWARDHHLKPGGKMFPDEAELWAAPCSLPALYGKWEQVYGFSMRAVGREQRRLKGQEPCVTMVEAGDLLAEPTLVARFDLGTVAPSQLDCCSVQALDTVSRDGRYQGLCLWFACVFPDDTPTILSTSPLDPVTHWKQTAILLPDELDVETGSPVAWELTLQRSAESLRRYDISFTMLDPEEVEHPVPCPCHMTKCIVTRTFLEKLEAEQEETQ